MVMRGLLLVRSEVHLKHADTVVFKQNLVVGGRSYDSVQRRVPCRGI